MKPGRKRCEFIFPLFLLPAAAFVNAYLGLGDSDQAFAWLEQAYKEQSNILQFVKVHPFF